MQTIAVYEGGLASGGPEEGGWWYWTGELVPMTIRRTLTKKGAFRVMRRLREKYPAGSDRSSVIPRDLDFEVEMFSGWTEPPQWIPETRPRYE